MVSSDLNHKLSDNIAEQNLQPFALRNNNQFVVNNMDFQDKGDLKYYKLYSLYYIILLLCKALQSYQGHKNYLGLFQKKGIQQNSCLLFIGRDWARIDIYTDGFITLSRDIKTGYLSLVMAVTDAINQNRTVSAKDSSSSLQDISLVSAESVEQFMMDELYKRKSSKDFKQIMGITEIQIEEMISPVLNRLAKQIDRTLEFFKSKSC